MEHLGRGSVLPELAIDPEPDAKLVRVWNLVRGDEPGPDNGKSVEALCPVHAMVIQRRDVSRGQVAETDVAGYRVQRGPGLEAA
jgi:hypothetical protein